MINYFYNITLKSDVCDFYSDVLTSVRKDFYLSKEKQKGKLTQNSSFDTMHYEFSIERDRTMKWLVSDDELVYSDVKNLEDSKYSINYYDKTGLYKRLIFSKLHTLLRVEYFDMTTSGSAYCSIEPRKSDSGLCLLLSNRGVCVPVILYPMPCVDDEYILDKIEEEFTDYSAVASTNDGVVRFLSQGQLDLFEAFVDRAQALKLTETAPVSFIDKDDAVLASKLNPKDFNLKRNLSQVIDISQAQEFSYEVEDILLGEISDEYVESEPDITPETICKENIENFETEIVAEPEITIEPEIETEPKSTQQVADALNIEEAETVEEVDSTDIPEIVSENTSEIIPDVVDTVAVEQTISDSDDSEVCGETDDNVEVEVFDKEDINVVCDTSDETDCFVDEDVSDEFICADSVAPDKVIENGTNKYLYFGELDDYGRRNGFGRTATENGHTAYEGDYLENKRNGQGAYYYKDGMLCYFGDWKDNKRDGFGVGVSSFDKSVHVGKFKDNKPYGEGVRVDSDGNVKFVTKTLSNGMKVVIKFEGDKIDVLKYNEKGELISDNSSNLIYF